MKALPFAIVLFLFSAAHGAEPPASVDEGVNFRNVVPAQAVSVPPGRVEVLEFFWYGCAHCYASETAIAEWLKDAPAEVVFRRIPVTLNRGWEVMARAYYTAQQLGVLDTVHPALFEALHEQQRSLDTEEELAAFFTETAAIDAAAFREAYNSLEVASRVQQADLVARRYGIRGVPTMAVNGKYSTDAELARGYSEMVDVVDRLVQQEIEALRTAK